MEDAEEILTTPKGNQSAPMAGVPQEVPKPSSSRPPTISQKVFEKSKGRPNLSHKPAVQFEVKEEQTFKPKTEPEFKYKTELQHQTDAEQVYQRLLNQPVTLTLAEVLGSSFELGKRFLSANRSHCFPTQKGMANHIKYEDEPEGDLELIECEVECGEVEVEADEALHERAY